MIKGFLLFIALVLPVAIYLFLQGFGNNIYELPKLYQTELPADVSTTCSNIVLPHVLSFEKYGINSELPKVLDIRMNAESNSFLDNEFNRVNNYFLEKRYERVLIGNSSLVTPNYTKITVEDLSLFVNCTLLHTDNNSFMVLVDKDGFIRSYYDKNDRADFDRLIVELEILKKFN